jgi:RNase H-like domain found in reverse transcriptase/Integrase zinc binding domain/Reverse transcriptase (RNA-dependent DNA polymerase)
MFTTYAPDDTDILKSHWYNRIYAKAKWVAMMRAATTTTHRSRLKVVKTSNQFIKQFNHGRAFGVEGTARRQAFHYWVNTMYKRKAEKVRPVDDDGYDGGVPGGYINWRDLAAERQRRWLELHPQAPHEFDQFLAPRCTTFPRGRRLTDERLSKLDIGGTELTVKERELAIEMLYRREGALAWDFSECGRISEQVLPPQEIRTVPHTPWQTRAFPVPKKLQEVVRKILLDRLNSGRLERSQANYRNPWFLVKKKNGGYRLINNAQLINAVTIRDAGLPPSADDFSEAFAGCTLCTCMDLFSGYDQVPLHKNSRDITSFQTPLGQLRMTTLPQGATNSVAQFQRCAEIMTEHESSVAKAFVDDITVAGSKSHYDYKEVVPGVRKYVLEAIQNCDRVLLDLERAGATVSGEKLQLLKPGLVLLGYWVDGRGRRPAKDKTQQITGWERCEHIKDVRVFVGLCVYYRVWIRDFTIIMQPLFFLLKKDVAFVWGPEQEVAMTTVKRALTSAPALVAIDYSDKGGPIILATDASGKGWGAALMQEDSEDKKKRHPVRFESGVWSKAERKYDSGKLELRGVVYAFSRLRLYLYGARFRLETDNSNIVAMINRTSTDLPGALVQRWLAWTQLFDFDVRHVPGTKNGAADALSRSPAFRRNVPEEPEVDIDDYIDSQIHGVRCELDEPAAGVYPEFGCSAAEVYPEQLGPPQLLERENDDEPVLDGCYSEEHQEIGEWLMRMRRPPDLKRREFTRFKRKALRFVVVARKLYRRNPKTTIPVQAVIDDPQERDAAIQKLHNEMGHRGREQTFYLLMQRYWWPGMYEDVRKFVKTCEECQKASDQRYEESLRTALDGPGIFTIIHIDCTGMPEALGKNTIIQARCAISIYVEAEALKCNKPGTPNSQQAAKFLYEHVITRHGVFAVLVSDGGPENQGVVIELMRRYGIRIRTISAYNSRGNGIVENGHKPFIHGLRKLTKGTGKAWPKHMAAMKWADRCTVKKGTGYTPAYIVHGRELVLPIETDLPTVQTRKWPEETTDTASLLALRVKQIDRLNQDLNEATLKLWRKRLEAKNEWDAAHAQKERPLSEPLEEGNLVLLRRVQLDNEFGKSKLQWRWLGPYRIHKADLERNNFVLEELDGATFAKPVHGNRLKRYFQREQKDECEPAEEEMGEEDLAEELYGSAGAPEENDEDGDSEGNADHDELRRSRRVLEQERLRARGESGVDGGTAVPDDYVPRQRVEVVIPVKRTTGSLAAELENEPLTASLALAYRQSKTQFDIEARVEARRLHYGAIAIEKYGLYSKGELREARRRAKGRMRAWKRQQREARIGQATLRTGVTHGDVSEQEYWNRSLRLHKDTLDPRKRCAGC